MPLKNSLGMCIWSYSQSQTLLLGAGHWPWHFTLALPQSTRHISSGQRLCIRFWGLGRVMMARCLHQHLPSLATQRKHPRLPQDLMAHTVRTFEKDIEGEWSMAVSPLKTIKSESSPQIAWQPSPTHATSRSQPSSRKRGHDSNRVMLKNLAWVVEVSAPTPWRCQKARWVQNRRW